MYPGACVTEYESIIQIVVRILIGRDQDNHCGNSVFLTFPRLMQIIVKNRQGTHFIHI